MQSDTSMAKGEQSRAGPNSLEARIQGRHHSSSISTCAAS